MTRKDEQGGRVTDCPTDLELERYQIHGESAAKDSALIEHLQSCPRCQEHLRELQQADEFGVLLREAHADFPPERREHLARRATDALREG